jgi:hypothetical protein
MHSKVFSDWLPSYINATRPVEILKMAGYFPDSPRIQNTCRIGGIREAGVPKALYGLWEVTWLECRSLTVSGLYSEAH